MGLLQGEIRVQRTRSRVRGEGGRPSSPGQSCYGQLDDNLSLGVSPLDAADQPPPSSASQALQGEEAAEYHWLPT